MACSNLNKDIAPYQFEPRRSQSEEDVSYSPDINEVAEVSIFKCSVS